MADPHLPKKKIIALYLPLLVINSHVSVTDTVLSAFNQSFVITSPGHQQPQTKQAFAPVD